MRTKKNLMLVRTGFQLLQAYHIKKKILKNEPTDIMLISDRFDEGYAERLRKSFDKAIFIGPVYPSGYEKYTYFLSPQKALFKIGITDLDEYTDVYFYNSGYVFYYLRKYEKLKHHPFRWHIIQDSQSNYLIDVRTYCCVFDDYRNNLFQSILKFIDYRVFNIVLKDFDEYIWKPELRILPVKNITINVPEICCNDTSYISEINDLFGYYPRRSEIKCVFLGPVSEGKIGDKVFEVLIHAGKKFGKDKIILLAHPGENLEKYNYVKDYITVEKSIVPWEITCLNKEINDNCVVIGFNTGALANCFIISDLRGARVYSIIGRNDDKSLDSNISELFGALEKRFPEFKCVKSIEDVII